MNEFKAQQAFYSTKTFVHQSQTQPKPSSVGKQISTQPSFAEHLQRAVQPNKIQFSQHAQMRLEERGIDLSIEQLHKLEQGLQKAQQKGAKESLMLMEDLAFIVSVPKQTVITAMEQSGMNNHVVTNIDSAVLLK